MQKLVPPLCFLDQTRLGFPSRHFRVDLGASRVPMDLILAFTFRLGGWRTTFQASEGGLQRCLSGSFAMLPHRLVETSKRSESLQS